jgi:osmotically-inducible protein OsmY
MKRSQIMKTTLLRRIPLAVLAVALGSLCATAEQHKWAGRTLDDVESAIHDRLAALPSYGVFDTIDFELQGPIVTLSGKVLKESVKQNAETAVRRIAGVEKVVNKIEVLPASRRDDALRTNVYRAIYDNQPLEKYGTRATPPIHIIVKDGWVSLEGVVDSLADRQEIHKRALSVAAHVSDNLRVAPEGV